MPRTDFQVNWLKQTPICHLTPTPITASGLSSAKSLIIFSIHLNIWAMPASFISLGTVISSGIGTQSQWSKYYPNLEFFRKTLNKTITRNRKLRFKGQAQKSGAASWSPTQRTGEVEKEISDCVSVEHLDKERPEVS